MRPVSPVRWTPDRDALLTKRHRSGVTLDQLAERFGATYPAIKHRVRHLGLARTAPPPWTAADDDTLIDAVIDAQAIDHIPLAWALAAVAVKLKRTAAACERRVLTLRKKKML